MRRTGVPTVKHFLEKPEKHLPSQSAGQAITPMKPDNPFEHVADPAFFRTSCHPTPIALTRPGVARYRMSEQPLQYASILANMYVNIL
jgi:hypothetical protein